MTYTVQPWREQYARHCLPFWKRGIYYFARKPLSWLTRRHLSKENLKKWKPDYVLPGRGFCLETRRKWALKNKLPHGKTILVQGTGTGWDVISWAELHPERIIASDLYSFESSWKEIAVYCRTRFSITPEFVQSPLEEMPFLPNESVDFCVSDAVFEHCKNLPAVLKEAWRVLKPGGYLYASYGPLWPAPGGDHFSARGKLEEVYYHLSSDREGYRQFVAKHTKKEEDCQTGARYIELDLFSKLGSQQYLDYFQQAGFRRDGLVLQISPTALRFKKTLPGLFLEKVTSLSPTWSEDDLLIFAHLIRLQKTTYHASPSR